MVQWLRRAGSYSYGIAMRLHYITGLMHIGKNRDSGLSVVCVICSSPGIKFPGVSVRNSYIRICILALHLV